MGGELTDEPERTTSGERRVDEARALLVEAVA